MNTTRELLAAVKQRHGLTTDYQLAKFLGFSVQRISNNQAGAAMNDDAAIKVADALALERGRVLAIVAAERAKSDQAKREWLKLAAAVAAVAVVTLFAPDQLAALLPASDVTEGAWLTLYIMSSLALALLAARALVRFFPTDSRPAPR
jgi:hypothetical protein